MAREQRAKQVETIAGDRREDRRYDIHLEMRWKLIRRRRVLETGVGRTVDLSSGGILFETSRALPVGLNVELSVAWPVMLQNVAPMQLVIFGRIIRSDGTRTAAEMVQHEFRTAGSASERGIVTFASRPPINLMKNPNLFFAKAE